MDVIFTIHSVRFWCLLYLPYSIYSYAQWELFFLWFLAPYKEMDDLLSILMVSLKVGCIFIRQQPPQFNNLGISQMSSPYLQYVLISHSYPFQEGNERNFAEFKYSHLVKIIESLISAKKKKIGDIKVQNDHRVCWSHQLCLIKDKSLGQWLKSKWAPERNRYILRNMIIKIWLSSHLMSADSSSVNGVCLTSYLPRLNKLLETSKCQPFFDCY